jgi:hypothetical protein
MVIATTPFHDVGNVSHFGVCWWVKDTDDSTQYAVEEYSDPAIVQDDLQSAQGQIAWLARNTNEGKEHVSRIKKDLGDLWVEFLQERRYMRHLIEEHLAPLQRTINCGSCECPIVGSIGCDTTAVSSFEELSLGESGGLSVRIEEGPRFRGSPASMPPLEPKTPDSASTSESFVSFWEKLSRSPISPAISPSRQEVTVAVEVEEADEEDDEEVWEDADPGDSGGSCGGGEGEVHA